MSRPACALVILAFAGCGGGEEEGEPVTPPVANPAQARSLAGRYEPDLMIERHDGFWPVSVQTIDLLRGSRSTCLALDEGARCDPTRIGELGWDTGPKPEYLDYPAGNDDPAAQHEALVRALESNAPGSKAQIYFYVTGRSPDRPVSLQYWFYYPYNYLLGHLGPVTLDTDLHEGDFEGMSILLSAHKHQPVYVWMPRHTEEGERFAWNEGALQRRESHPVGFVARGSHATYESCGRKFRNAFFKGIPIDIPDDQASCAAGDMYELGATVPVVNLARTSWACWPGHFGYAPGFGSPRNAFEADGPLSPLFQQKFDLRNPRPCEKVAAPVPPVAAGEVLPDPDTATALGASGGRLNDLFRSCDDWSQRPPQGSYMVACDPATLEAFFESGLEDAGQQDLRILGDPGPTGPTVPAVFASPDPRALERATIRTREAAKAEIYAAVRRGSELETVEFPALELDPEQRLRLRRTNDSVWRLIDAAAGGQVVASARVSVTEAGVSPQVPTILSATRRGDEIDLRFSGGTNPATRLVAFGGSSRQSLGEGGRLVGSVRGEAPGKYELTIADPAAAIHFLRVVASLDGALAASPLAAVAAGP